MLLYKLGVEVVFLDATISEKRRNCGKLDRDHVSLGCGIGL